MQNTVIESVSDSDFEKQVLQSDIPVLVDFWAPWCGPCKALSPILEGIASDYASRLKIVKMNVDENPEIPARFNIRGIPTLILFKDGSPVETKVGALNKTQLIAYLDGNLTG